MASFRSLTTDRQPFEEFRDRASKVGPVQHNGIDLHLLEWYDDAAPGRERNDLRSISQLEEESKGTVRVIFAPRDIPIPRDTEGLLELFEACEIPSAFVDESLQDVSQSFAARNNVDGTTFVWFHFLCKTVTVVKNQIVHIENDRDIGGSESDHRRVAQLQSQANFSWMKPGIILKIWEQQPTNEKPARTSTSDSEKTLMAPGVQTRVDLFCFGAPSTLHQRFQNLLTTAKRSEILDDPYLLMEVVFEEMYKVLDGTGWAVADIFGLSETETLELATKPGQATEKLPKTHFTGLHNLAKHTVYLRENCDAALATLDDFSNHHKTVVGESPNPSQKFARQALKYRKTLFESTQRRLSSLDARISNIIQLSFHIVTQGDSKVMQSENKSMKTIAVMTLIFMPLGTVASIFGSQFMRLQEEPPYKLFVSPDFWLMWVIAAPLTILLIGIWLWWYDHEKKKLLEERESGHGYARLQQSWTQLINTRSQGNV
ncbi:CorA Mg2+ and Co2+ transporter [Pyrenophora tritici-repentis]|uniref:CorA Mg2+ transporter protein n=1 Tax=Pyrenophora tritici-repentis TaxID=45151 RepID=A0A5M9L994_9PLEO|nr:CorA Mg2+ and Co2+ transporter [Pyrenophora tritici-repentis]KAF7448060.1 CorA Mg2+ and Co2+ transporter [Pyrenophora tritici-repentis]KAF7571764.1 CorA, Mg2+ and Co2+ transporter [Pyrenophora tritici-repentis]KAI0578062.1 CorA Mg2+ and Co2+ transporter [Pyrenophora tritici-repentis]KAI0582760.1 CorA Mg2+ and Co2+ transporter [Pyrenophora tritici-repentis]